MKLRIPFQKEDIVIPDFAAFNFFLWLNFLVFFDRGIIAGATVHFNEFIVESTGSTQPDVLLGVLQTFFVLGMVSGSLALSHFVVRYDRFLLATVALCCWIFAVILSGISYFANSYGLLLFARWLAGFGEASILFDIPSWIQHVAPMSHRGTWLGIFYAAIPLGITLGYGYSAALAESSLTWASAFFIEGILTLPLVFFMGSIADDSPEDESGSHGHGHKKSHNDDDDSPDHLRDEENDDDGAVTKNVLHEKGNSPLKATFGPGVKNDAPVTRNRRCSMLEEVLTRVSLSEGITAALQSPIFIAICLGSAAQAATMAAWYTFGSPLLLNLGYYEEEVSASTTFGILMSIAGLVGTPLGGYLLDYMDPGGYSEKDKQKHVYVYYRRQPFLHTMEEQTFGEENEAHTDSVKAVTGSSKELEPTVKYQVHIFIQRACGMLYWLSLGNFVCFITMAFAVEKAAFLFVLTLAFTLCHMTSAAILVSQSIEIKHMYQCIVSEIGLIFLHFVGDAPATLFAGYMKSTYAPECAIEAVSAACRQEGSDLRWMIFYIGLWSFAAVVFFAVAWWKASDLCVAKIMGYKKEQRSFKRLQKRQKKKQNSKKDIKRIEMQRLLNTEFDH